MQSILTRLESSPQSFAIGCQTLEWINWWRKYVHRTVLPCVLSFVRMATNSFVHHPSKRMIPTRRISLFWISTCLADIHIEQNDFQSKILWSLRLNRTIHDDETCSISLIIEYENQSFHIEIEIVTLDFYFHDVSNIQKSPLLVFLHSISFHVWWMFFNSSNWWTSMMMDTNEIHLSTSNSLSQYEPNCSGLRLSIMNNRRRMLFSTVQVQTF